MTIQDEFISKANNIARREGKMFLIFFNVPKVAVFFIFGTSFENSLKYYMIESAL